MTRCSGRSEPRPKRVDCIRWQPANRDGPWRQCSECVRQALSHYGTVDTAIPTCFSAHAAETTSRHVSMADALKARCVLAEVRWRWTLKVLWAACTERNLCADPTLLNPCIFLS